MTTIEIPLTQGLVARISACDAARVSQLRWHARRAPHTTYAAAKVGNRTVYMHRLVMGAVEAGRGVHVDHKNYDGLDNTRENLRLCSPAQNSANRRTRKTYLGLRGVTAHNNRWVAQIGVAGQWIYLGCYDTEREAGIAYDAAAAVAFGKHAPERRHEPS